MKYNIFWFRRDLRLVDNAGLYHALRADLPVKCIFIFDEHILAPLPKKDARVEFIHNRLATLKRTLQEYDSDLHVYHGDPVKIFTALAEDKGLQKVFANKDYEVYAKERDNHIRKLLGKAGKGFQSFKDHVIFDEEEVVKSDGDPYVVFTPYKNTWLDNLQRGIDNPFQGSFYLEPYSSYRYLNKLMEFSSDTFPTLDELGFQPTDIPTPDDHVPDELIREYDKNRDYPAAEGTSRLSVHLRFGTISIRKLAARAKKLNATFLSELIWRDFYSNILNHFQHVEKASFRRKYDDIEWVNDETTFQAWCAGKTGYPMVDAGMRELNETGFMHNRVRMITSSFLTKHLLTHWSWGERYFAEKLLDYDLASNNGGWQWAAGSGTDAAPYFRIFNPTTQLKKYDPDEVYVRKWIPEYDTHDYPDPIIDHKEARERALAVFKRGLDG